MTTITLTVGAPAHGGHCIARHEGRAVFVRHALPGEVVEAEVLDAKPDARFWNADAVRIIEASPDRVEHPWPEAAQGGVGGAELGHVALPAQRAWKDAVLVDAFARFAGIEYANGVKAVPGDDERGGLGYRTRVSAVAGDDGRATMALQGGGGRRTLSAMPLATPAAEASLLAADAAPGDRIEVMETSTGWVHVVRGTRGAGKTLTEKVGDLTYTLNARDFWQVHRGAPEVLTSEVLSRIGKGERVMDLYAGAGLFSVALAATGREVTAVESAYGPAKSALERNLERFSGARAIMGDARRTLERLTRDGESYAGGTIVLDPPRAGAKAATVDSIVALEPERVVYVACDPVALARDAALLVERGYAFDEAQAWDLFPMTHHIETVASFTRR